jgi:hypothetical protein
VGRGAGVAFCLFALALGIGAGRWLLPEPLTGHTLLGGLLPFGGTEPSSPRSTSPTPGPGPARPTYTRTPPTDADLVSVAAFRRAGMSVEVYPENGNTASGTPVSLCTSARTVGARTLGDITGHDPQLLGTWDEPSTTATADEVVAMAESPSAAETAADRLLAAHTTCQHRPVGQWVYGQTRRRQLTAGAWAAWLGVHPGAQNHTGQAPADAEPCGGVAVLRNGLRFAVLEVFMCTDSEQLRTLALDAASRLG